MMTFRIKMIKWSHFLPFPLDFSMPDRVEYVLLVIDELRQSSNHVIFQLRR